MFAPPARVALRSSWRATPSRLARLLLGLTLFGAGDACLVAGELGNSPWTVFAQGVSLNTTLGIGAATIATSSAVLLLWIPLRQLPGLGTVANAVVIALAIGPGVQLAVGVLSTPVWRRLEDPAQPVSQIAPSRSSTG